MCNLKLFIAIISWLNLKSGWSTYAKVKGNFEKAPYRVHFEHSLLHDFPCGYNYKPVLSSWRALAQAVTSKLCPDHQLLLDLMCNYFSSQEVGSPDFPGGLAKIANTLWQPSLVKRTPRNFSSWGESVRVFELFIKISCFFERTWYCPGRELQG